MARLEWDSGNIAAGAAIDSPIFDTNGLLAGFYIIADNSAGGATRNITMDSLLSDFTVVDSAFAIRTVAITTKERGVVGPQNVALGTAPALVFAYGAVLPTKVRFHLAAGGAAVGRLIIFGN